MRLFTDKNFVSHRESKKTEKATRENRRKKDQNWHIISQMTWFFPCAWLESAVRIVFDLM